MEGKLMSKLTRIREALEANRDVVSMEYRGWDISSRQISHVVHFFVAPRGKTCWGKKLLRLASSLFPNIRATGENHLGWGPGSYFEESCGQAVGEGVLRVADPGFFEGEFTSEDGETPAATRKIWVTVFSYAGRARRQAHLFETSQWVEEFTPRAPTLH